MRKKREVQKAGLPAPAEPCVPIQNPQPAVSRRERVALLAYSYWEQRGCQGGSPEEDWFRAEREVDLSSSTKPGFRS